MLVWQVQLHESEHLPRHVPVLTEAAHLVVTDLRLLAGECGRLGVLVHLRLPPPGGHGPEAGGSVNEGDGPPDPPGDLGGLTAAFDERREPPAKL